MQKREPFVAPDMDLGETPLTYVDRVQRTANQWAYDFLASQEQPSPAPQPEAKPYAAKARDWAAEFAEKSGWNGQAHRIRHGGTDRGENAAIEALRANIAALVEPVDSNDLYHATDGQVGVVSAGYLTRAGLTIIRTPDHD